MHAGCFRSRWKAVIRGCPPPPWIDNWWNIADKLTAPLNSHNTRPASSWPFPVFTYQIQDEGDWQSFSKIKLLRDSWEIIASLQLLNLPAQTYCSWQEDVAARRTLWGRDSLCALFISGRMVLSAASHYCTRGQLLSVIRWQFFSTGLLCV